MDSALLSELAAAIEYLQATMTYHGLGDVQGIAVNFAAHARLSSLRLRGMVELDEPRASLDPEICGVPIRNSLA